MKKFFKRTFIFLLVIAIIGGGIWLYFKFANVKNYELFSVVPEETIFVIETNNLTQGWNALSNGKIWNHIKKTDVFAEYNEMFSSIDSMIKDNTILETLLSGRQLLMTAHMISKDDYDFLYIVQVDKAGKASFTAGLAELFDYSVTKHDYKGNEIIDFTDVTTKETFSVCFLGNVVLVSFSPTLVEKAIDQSELPSAWTSERFSKVASGLPSGNMFRFYINNRMLRDYMSVFFEEGLDMASSFGESTSFLGTGIDLADDNIRFSGTLGIFDSVPSYIRALANIKPSEANSFQVVSDNAALYLNLTFSSFDQFLTELKNQYQTSDSVSFTDIDKDISKIESYLKVSLDDDFFGWIGNEISLVKLTPNANSKEDDVVAYFHAPDMEKAKTGLDHLCRQIKRRTPLKFKEYDYKGFPINMLSIKGFFKMFLGNLFEGFEKPYFTYIDDYVVFSNSTGALMQSVDDFMEGKTLAKNPSFKNITGSCPVNANVFVYLNTPKFYRHLLKSSIEESRPGVEDNKELILSFSDIGISMISDGGNFDFEMKWQHDPNIFGNLKILEIEKAAEEMEFVYFDTLGFMFDLTGLPINEGPVQLQYDNETVSADGSLSEGKPQGIWRLYYPSGNLMGLVRFEAGIPEGSTTFFYDLPEKTDKALIEYENGVMVNIYKEWYKNGKIKCEVEVNDGVPHGDAVFYYENAVVKMEGNYEDSLMDGKWLIYNELGKEIAKKKYKKGEEN